MVQGGLDGMLALCEVMIDKERSRQYLIDLKRITDDAGRDAARLENEKRADEFSQREAALIAREEECRQLTAAGLEVDRRLGLLNEREAAATAREARLNELQTKLAADQAQVATLKADLDRRLALIKRLGAT